MIQNRVVVSQARLYTVPALITGQYTINETDLRLSPGGTIRYDMSQLDGLLHAVYRAAGPNPADLEITAVGKGGSTLLLKHRLAPSERIVDTLPYVFLYNSADLPPGTEQIVLSVPSTSPSPVDWQRIGSISRDQFPALNLLPLDFLYFDAFQPLGWSEPFFMIHAPTRLVFRVPAGHHRLSFGYGYNPATFLDPNAYSDGAEISVSLTTPSGSRSLLKRLLEPGVKPADRELQTANLELDLTEPALLEFVATAGPNENTAWDWLVLRDVRLETGGHLAGTKLP